jgi:homoserine O-succinyltransferase
MLAFYRNWESIKHENFDGFIVTGAPVELLEFESVTYWDELRRIFDWTQTNVHSTMNICWGAQASLYHFHGVQKHTLSAKAFGVYRHRNLNPSSPFLRGFSDDFSIPVSRWTEVRRSELPANAGIEVLIESDEVGLCLINDAPHAALHMFNHIEYDTRTLSDEYWRDVNAGRPIEMPSNYFPANDPNAPPENRWRSHAHLLFGNWINEVYQTTPFEIGDIGRR